MHFVKFRDENGNLLVTNRELDDILDFFTIFFIVKIYLSKEEKYEVTKLFRRKLFNW